MKKFIRAYLIYAIVVVLYVTITYSTCPQQALVFGYPCQQGLNFPAVIAGLPFSFPFMILEYFIVGDSLSATNTMSVKIIEVLPVFIGWFLIGLVVVPIVLVVINKIKAKTTSKNTKVL